MGTPNPQPPGQGAPRKRRGHGTRRFLVVALAVAAVAGVTASLLLAGPGRRPNAHRLPGEIRAVELAGLPLTPSLRAEIHRSRLNAVVLREGISLQTSTGTGLPGLMVLHVRTQRGTSHAAGSACRRLSRRSSEPCTVRARSIPLALQLSRTPGVDLVVVRLPGPRGLVHFSRTVTHGRVLALVPLPKAGALPVAAWRQAIQTARTSSHVDLGVVVKGSRARRALRRYLRLLRESAGGPAGGGTTTPPAGGSGGGSTPPGSGGSPSPPPPSGGTVGAPPRPPLPPPPPLPPASVFVAPNGSDANPCTKAAPCASFDRAYHVAAPGQVVEVAGGTYGKQFVQPDPSKTSPDDVIFAPATGASVTLTDELRVFGNHVTFTNMAATDWYIGGGASDITMRALDVGQFYITGGTNVDVIGGDIGPVDRQSSAITIGYGVRPANILIDGAYIHDYTALPGDHVQCLAVWSVSNFILRNSTFSNCTVFDLFVAGLNGPLTDHATVENNFFGETRDQSQPVRFAATDSVFRYNSVDGSVFADPAYGSNRVLQANIGYISGCGNSTDKFSYNVSSGSVCSPTDTKAAEGFTNARSSPPDLHLTAGAAAIGHGDPASFPPFDIDGQARPQGKPDAGADER